jgi:plasmid stability protein
MAAFCAHLGGCPTPLIRATLEPSWLILGAGMADVRVRKLNEWVVDWFRAQAERHGRSLEGELREALTEAGLRSKREFGAELRADLTQLEAKYGQFTDSSTLIREDRDRRGTGQAARAPSPEWPRAGRTTRFRGGLQRPGGPGEPPCGSWPSLPPPRGADQGKVQVVARMTPLGGRRRVRILTADWQSGYPSVESSYGRGISGRVGWSSGDCWTGWPTIWCAPPASRSLGGGGLLVLGLFQPDLGLEPVVGDGRAPDGRSRAMVKPQGFSL